MNTSYLTKKKLVRTFVHIISKFPHLLCSFGLMGRCYWKALHCSQMTDKMNCCNMSHVHNLTNRLFLINILLRHQSSQGPPYHTLLTCDLRGYPLLCQCYFSILQVKFKNSNVWIILSNSIGCKLMGFLVQWDFIHIHQCWGTLGGYLWYCHVLKMWGLFSSLMFLWWCGRGGDLN